MATRALESLTKKQLSGIFDSRFGIVHLAKPNNRWIRLSVA